MINKVYNGTLVDLLRVMQAANEIGRISFDIESNHAEVAQDDWELWGTSIYAGNEAAYFTDIDVQRLLVDLLWVFEGKVLAHNPKFDLMGLKKTFKKKGFPKNIICTMIGMNLIDEHIRENALGLKDLVESLFHYRMMRYEEAIIHGRDSEVFANYCIEDSVQCDRLWLYEEPLLVKDDLMRLLQKVLMEALKVVMDMERYGFGWDLETGRELLEGYTKKVQELEVIIRQKFGQTINLNSKDQIAVKLFTPVSEGGFGVSTRGLKKTKTGKRYVVDADVLERLADKYPVCALLRDRNFANDMISKYVWKITTYAMKDPHSRVHATTWLNSTTGRTRQVDPPNQTVPEKNVLDSFKDEAFWIKKHKKVFAPQFRIRRGFRARPKHKFIVSDFSGFQLRLNAHIAPDEEMIRAFCAWKCNTCNSSGSHNILLLKCPKCGAPSNEDVLKGKAGALGFWHGADLHQETYEYINKYLGREVLKSRQDGKCVDVDSLIYEDGEYKRIGSLCDVRVPDTFTPIPETDVYSNVITTKCSTFFSDGERDRLLIVTNRGIICGTGLHKIQTPNGLVQLNALKEYDELKDIQIPEVLNTTVFPKVSWNPFFEEFSVKPFQMTLNYDWAYFAGLWIGDGSQSNNAFSITVDSNPEASGWRDSVCSSLRKVGIQVQLSKDSTTYRFGSRRLLRFLNLLGLKPKKGVEILTPSWVLNNRLMILGFLAGLTDTDGAVDEEDTEAYICTKSWRLASDICVMVKSLGCKKYRLSTKWNSVQKKYYYIVCLGRECSTMLIPLLKHRRKSFRLAVAQFEKEPTTKPLQPLTIRKIFKLPAGQVVDLNVKDPNHLYMVDGFLTHNTCNFELIFLATSWTMNKNHPEYDIKTWDAIMKAYFTKYQGTKNYHAKQERLMNRTGQTHCLFGRKRRILPAEIAEHYKHALNQFVNAPVQTSEVNYALYSMAMIRHKLSELDLWNDGNFDTYGAGIVHFNHDEIITEVPDELVDIVKDVQENTMRYAVPLKVPVDVETKVSEVW